MRALVVLHRWLGIGFCLLFAMWFATGIVMHFVPFPSLTETERVAGLMPVDLALVRHGPDEAARTGPDARRARLVQRSDGPVYILSGGSKPLAVGADDLRDASVTSEPLALAIAQAHAKARGIGASHAAFAERADYDQWTVPNGFDPHRPLYRVALNDAEGTEIYVSSSTGEVVLDTTRHERAWNYAGSVTHWIYPTLLRSNWAAWDKTVWWLSLAALIAALTGVALGLVRIRVSGFGLRSPFRGWHAWHHILGLLTATFVISWIFSGWLSMDHGRLFSRGQLSDAEAALLVEAPDWNGLAGEWLRISGSPKEIEWFGFNRKFYRRERMAIDAQRLFTIGPSADPPSSPFLTPAEIDALAARTLPGCAPSVVVGADDDYAASSPMPKAPVYRAVCGDVWLQFDGASGAILERLDSSRRSYRWYYSALHTMDIPALMAQPSLRSALIVILCGFGLVFSLTGVVIGWRRLRLQT